MARHNQYINIVKEIIEKYASAGKPVKPSEIKDYIDELYPDDTCERKTIARALERLREEYGVFDNGEWKNPNQLLQYEVQTRHSSDIFTNYYFDYCEDDEDKLTDGELSFLIDAVQFSNHISPKNSNAIIEKLLKLGEKDFHNHVNYKKIDDNYHPVSSDFFMIQEDIYEAIRKDKKVSFYLNDYNTKLKKVRVCNRPIVVNPYCIVNHEGNSYLLCRHAGSTAFRNYRIDMISDVKIMDETSDVDDMEVKKLKKHPEDYIVEHLYMTSGTPVEAVLQIDRSILCDLADAFGSKIGIDEDDDSNCLTVHIRSSEKGIIDWALKYGEFVTVIEPEYLREEIRDRASRIGDSYRDRNYDIDYLERIADAQNNRRLRLFHINLNGRDSYKTLEGIKSATFHHNGITDFSFLDHYADLEELTITNNRISDSSSITDLSNLRILNLKNTGITNLDFLRGLDHLRRLSVNEISLENIDAIYDLQGLRFLHVSKPVARLIDKRRLSDDVELTVGSYPVLIPLMGNRLPSRDNRFLKREGEALKGFSTFAVKDAKVRAKLGALVYTGVGASQRHREKLFCLVEGVCSAAERLELYENFSRYTGEEYSWYVSYDGSAPKEMSELDVEKVCAISVFKNNHGKKLVALLRYNADGREQLERSYNGLWSQIRYIIDNKIGCAEVCDDAERRFCQVSTIDEVIDPSVIKKVYKDAKIDEDGYHYSRREAGDKKSVRRIAYGHIDA